MSVVQIDCSHDRFLCRLAMDSVVMGQLPDDLDKCRRWDILLDVICEYWHPSIDDRSIDLQVCPYWVSKDALRDRLDELWVWAEEQRRLVVSVVADACSSLMAKDVEANCLEAPYAWWWLLGHSRRVLGLKVSYGNWQTDLKGCVFSRDEFGSFATVQWERVPIRRGYQL